jgi:hypothetical protein
MRRGGWHAACLAKFSNYLGITRQAGDVFPMSPFGDILGKSANADFGHLSSFDVFSIMSPFDDNRLRRAIACVSEPFQNSA